MSALGHLQAPSIRLDQDRDNEAEFPNARSEFTKLFFRMLSGVEPVSLQLVNCYVLNFTQELIW